MSRIGKQPIKIPAGVTVTVQDGVISVRGPKGELTRRMADEMGVTVREGIVEVAPRMSSRRTPALWGLTRSLIANMVAGVVSGFERKLEFEGVGYRAALEGNTLIMQLGFSHPVRFNPPAGVTLGVERNMISVSGADKEVVGRAAAGIRALRRPEPYKGKGIRYQGEVVRRKAGKKAVASA